MNPVHNPQTDAMRARYMAAIAARPALDPHDATCADLFLKNAIVQLREAWKLLQTRGDLAEPIERIGATCKALSMRLRHDEGAGNVQ